MSTTLSRRAWLAGALGVIPLARQRLSTADARVETVTGPVLASALGVTLMHEHVLVDFIGAAR